MDLKFTVVAVLAMLVGAVTVANLAYPAMAKNNDVQVLKLVTGSSETAEKI